jgi:hypothetical protein
MHFITMNSWYFFLNIRCLFRESYKNPQYDLSENCSYWILNDCASECYTLYSKLSNSMHLRTYILKPSGNYLQHLFWQPVTLNFVFTGSVYLSDIGVKSWPGDWLFWGFSWFSSVLPRKCLNNTLKLGHDIPLHPFQFIIHHPFGTIYPELLLTTRHYINHK